VEPVRRPEPDPDIRLVSVFATDDAGLAALIESVLAESSDRGDAGYLYAPPRKASAVSTKRGAAAPKTGP
jgi:hypothetical protein